MSQEVCIDQDKTVALDTCCRVHVVHVWVHDVEKLGIVFEVGCHHLLNIVNHAHQPLKLGRSGRKVSTTHDFKDTSLDVSDADDESRDGEAKMICSLRKACENIQPLFRLWGTFQV